MSEYRAPTREMAFTLRHLAGFDEMVKACNFEDASPDLVAAVLEEAAKFAGQALAPLNSSGDQTGVHLTADHRVHTPEGFRQAYRQYVEGGWAGLQFDAELGGQALPFSLAIPVQEMMHAANMAWGLCPLLSQGAVEALSDNASDSLKQLLLPKMISGEWTGTMNLTEPQAGSDLANIRTQARPEGDHYRITGQKIFITWGEHDMAENIVHLVLARLPDAPPGVKGISLFAVPKFIPDAEGNSGERNDCHALSLEHKMGIHASPTCVMSYGENGGALGYLVGEENRGLACMFTMMNNARLTVGLQGVAVSERALQMARDYVHERVQGIAPGDSAPSPIVRHPDVRRMVMTMKALTEAARGLAYSGCVAVDYARHAQLDDERRACYQRRADLLTPLVKGWCTEIAQEVTSLAVQCHGGMGYIEESGVAQLYRDARILPIYEGTNGIQALDLIGRKTIRDEGQAVQELIAEMRATAQSARGCDALDTARVDAFEAAIDQLDTALQQILGSSANAQFAGAVAFNYLMLSATLTAGWLLLKGAVLEAEDSLEPEGHARCVMAHFYIDHILPRCTGYLASIRAGEDSIMALSDDAL
ncbi:acyl-CoA dehydrogenase C-terminal domain-containing protein [Marinobacterium sp. AK62]|uniref:Acyl-CoA dehydrogenase C-terminal domain-containing protein n=1 Tax=Marinobacterium alkalitolerans TaxID=1542925 RepID=A0ABS3Z791_9GAMM|nr:acyl-CoA dehydrogenase [Marinobacterium alkalitolerans]MBP0047576.1 acyl-CoA dehydrogenase C-terminal domain-containing protein [Marinobacterium alkalitolerans]